MNLIEMWGTMGPMAKSIGVILVIMSMISFGVAIERIYTFTQARKQSKLYAPQVAKHLKDGRLKDAIAISSSKNYRYSHLAKVVLAGLQEYQFQQETGSTLTPEEPGDTARRRVTQRPPPPPHRRAPPVPRAAGDGRRHHHRVPGHRRHWARRLGRRLSRYFRSA